MLARTACLLLTLLIGTVPSHSAWALITGGKGNAPMKDPGWPAGAVDVANLKSRVGWWEGPPVGGGEYHFLYRGDAAAVGAALQKFAELQALDKVVILHDGRHESFFLRDKNDPTAALVDWSFTVWIPASWHRLFNHPRAFYMADHPNFRQPVASPQLDIYVGGAVDWDKVEVPAGLKITDRRLAAVGAKAEDGPLVRATVFDMATGKPVPGAELVLEPQKMAKMEGGERPRRAKTDNRGHAQITRVAVGTYQISVSAEGFAPLRLGYKQLRPNSVEYFPRVQLSKTATLKGVVVDEDGKPLAAAKVRLSSSLAINGRGYPNPARLEVETDQDGVFEIAGAAVGFARLRCRAAHFYQTTFDKLYDVPAKDIRIQMVPTGLVRVRVLDAVGEPVTGHHIAEIKQEGNPIGKWGGSARLKQGEYVFRGVPPGRYRVSAHPNPYSTRIPWPSKWVEVHGKKAIDVELKYAK